MLRPVDLTLTIQNAADAQRAGFQGTQAGRPEVASQMFADRLHKEVRQQEQQVGQTSLAEKADVNPDRQGDGKGYQPNRKPPNKKTEQSKVRPTKMNVGESMYDIKI
ncbi:MAG: hypothetical protein FWF77_09770 [Defluviitaleaceae bacterium]|nr:hypothetical protein [Defluviitaleaceae bacterium]